MKTGNSFCMQFISEEFEGLYFLGSEGQVYQ